MIHMMLLCFFTSYVNFTGHFAGLMRWVDCRHCIIIVHLLNFIIGEIEGRFVVFVINVTPHTSPNYAHTLMCPRLFEQLSYNADLHMLAIYLLCGDVKMLAVHYNTDNYLPARMASK